jgi:hypothetical protein
MGKDQQHISTEKLSALVDGDFERNADIDSHLKQCDRCLAELNTIRSLKSSLRLLADVEPERELWIDIKKSMIPAFSSKMKWLVPAAAMAGAAIALLLVLLVSVSGKDTSPGKVGALKTVINAEIEYRQAIASLENAVVPSLAGKNPKTKKVIQESLKEIDQIIEKCRLAFREHPKDRGAQEAVLAAYQYKVDLLTDLVAGSLD